MASVQGQKRLTGGDRIGEKGTDAVLKNGTKNEASFKKRDESLIRRRKPCLSVAVVDGPERKSRRVSRPYLGFDVSPYARLVAGPPSSNFDG